MNPWQVEKADLYRAQEDIKGSKTCRLRQVAHTLFDCGQDYDLDAWMNSWLSKRYEETFTKGFNMEGFRVWNSLNAKRYSYIQLGD